MQAKYLQLLADRKEKGSERSLLSFDTEMVDFWSNDYLGLGKVGHSVNLQSGSGSRLISGNSQTIEAVETFLAEHFQAESALIFNSGYDANLGFFSSVPQKGDTILYDEFIHASVRDGVRLSFARSYSFTHNNLDALEQRLAKAEGTIFVAIESLYSMDGDIAPLKEIASLCERYNALLIVDEAHAGGVFGKAGIGLCEEFGILSNVFARLVTFGKGFGAHGGVILGSSDLKAFLINFARSFIYTTALPEAFYTHIQTHVLLAREEELRLKLANNIRLFGQLVTVSLSDERSPIQIIQFDSLLACKEKAQAIQAAGFAVKAILPPTVPDGNQCIRICIHAFNTEIQLNKLAELLF